MSSNIKTPLHTLPCEVEPIHTPGCIQSYGFLIAFESTTEEILYVSENICLLTGTPPEKLLSFSISEVLEVSLSLDIQHAIQEGKLKSPRTTEITSYLGKDGEEYLVIGHSFNEITTLEFEPKETVSGLYNHFSWLDNAEQKLRDSKSLNDLLQETLSEAQSLLNFDRLMVYRFHEDEHGEVIAEQKIDALSSYLGLHFPALDVPPIARDLFFKTWVRPVVDINSPSVNIIHQASTKPLDMAYATIRGVSQCHIQYLRNMGVNTTITISIVNDGKLWGMLVGQHTKPKYLGFHQRNICQLFGRILSLLIPVKEKEDINNFIRKKERIMNRVILDIHINDDFYVALKNEMPRLLAEIESCGVALYFDNKITTINRTPSEKTIFELIKHALKSPVKNNNHFFSDHLSGYDNLNDCRGYTVFKIPEMGNACLLFFKEEYKHHIKWAGNPQNIILRENQETLTPRASFNLFLEKVEGKSKPWKKEELQLIELFVTKLKDEIIFFQRGQLRATNSILKTVYENAADALFLVRIPEGVILDCNQQALQFFDVESKSELIGFIGNEFNDTILSEEETDQKLKSIQAGITYKKEIKYKTAKGKTKWADYSAKLIEHFKPSCYLVRIIDITEKKIAEKTLEQQNSQLKKLNKELDSFVYSSSHDLRAPIASMLGLIEVAEQLDDAHEIKKLLQEGKKSMTRLDSFVQDILKYSKNTRLNVEYKEINLHTLIQNAVDNYRFTYKDNPINVTIDFPKDYNILSDEYRLNVILNNIISNAFKYRNPYIDNSYIKISLSFDAKKQYIHIEDNGIGISPKYIDKIFDMFYRADNFKSGSGLGLYIVREMADKIKAVITAESETNQGSKFTICLPKKP